MRKLLFVVNNFNIGGPQKSLLALLDNIDYDVFDVSLIMMEPDGMLTEYLNEKVKLIKIDELFTAYTLPSKKFFYYWIVMLKNKKFSAAFDFFVVLIKYLWNKDMNPERQRFWRKHSCELPVLEGHYHASFGVSSGLSTYFIVDCISSIKKYHWIRGDYSRTSIDKEIDKYYFNKVDGSLSVSNECSDIFAEIFPFMQDKIKVFYNILPIKFYERTASDTHDIFDDKDIKLLTVTRLDPEKGLDMALEAAEILMEKNKRFKWYILGDGEYRVDVEKLIQSKGLENHVFLLGFKINTFDYIKRCDIFVHPSRSEGKSNAVDEALFWKKPIVITNYETVKEQIIDKKNGFICDMNGEDIVNKIEYVVKNINELRDILARNTTYDYDKDPSEFFLNLL